MPVKNLCDSAAQTLRIVFITLCVFGALNPANADFVVGPQTVGPRIDYGGIRGHLASFEDDAGQFDADIAANELAAQAPTTFTYSFSNLFDGNIDLQSGFTRNELLIAVEEGFALWASVAPLTFVERDDSGPSVSDNSYRKSSHPDIRIGHHSISGNVLAHAFFPGSDGRDSDVHMDSGDQIWKEGTFFSTVTHEIGHAIGLDHFDFSTAIMNSELSDETTFNGLTGGKLFDPDVRAITKVYGSGQGEVVVARKWTGGPQGQWSVAENWDKGHYPTQRSRVEVDLPSIIEISQQGQNARSLDFTDVNTTLRMTSGSLGIREDMTLGSSIDTDHTNLIDVENGTLRIDGNLRMAEGRRSESVLNITNGQVEIGNRITRGDGTSRIVMSGGTLTVAGTTAGPTLASSESTARILIPNDDSLARDWTDVRFDDSLWQEASSSLGYERNTGFEGLFDTDLEAAMFDKSTTVYVRIPFQAEDASSLNKLDLDVNFDDGFVAYLNGQRVAARNAANVVAFNERALTSVSDDDATKTLTIDISQHLGQLVDGENVLAIHGLNRSKTNDDFLLVPRLRTSISDGSIEVNTLEFSGGQIFGVTRIEGSVALNDDEFSPNGATADSGPSELQITGRLDIANEAALRLDVGISTNDQIIVDGPISLGGELRLVSTGTVENPAERGTVEQRHLLEGSTVEGRFSLATFDEMPVGHMGDGVFRQLSYTDTDVSLLSYRTIAGDANGDGAFDSGDLVFVFQTDEYEDGIEANSDWTEGDWNGDREFDSGDIITAFQTGFYETGSILPNLVPEPQTNGLVVITFIIIGFQSRRRTRVWR